MVRDITCIPLDIQLQQRVLTTQLCVCQPLSLQGPRMVRDVFRLAKENAPAIIFIDEVDAIATARFDAQTGADREVQRILMELLNQMDGFDQTVNVKVRHPGLFSPVSWCQCHPVPPKPRTKPL